MEIMDIVFLPWHVREVNGSDGVQLFIGVYTTGQEARAAIERLKSQDLQTIQMDSRFS